MAGQGLSAASFAPKFSLSGYTSDVLSALVFVAASSLSQVTFDEFLVAGPFPSGGRTPCPTDPVAYEIAQGRAFAPKAGDKTADREWKERHIGADGWLTGEGLGGGYAYCRYRAQKAGTMILDASGHSMVYVNGVPRGGDPYGFGYVRLPVAIKKGDNDFLFSVGRGRVRASLTPTVEGLSVSNLDPTLPDVILGEQAPLVCSVLVVNSTNKPQSGRISGDLGGVRGMSRSFSITPMTVKKVWFETRPFAAKESGKVGLEVYLNDRNSVAQRFELDVKPRSAMHKRTFRSPLDGSVQYYAVQPASDPKAKALVLSLHGASVEAVSQAASYGQKSWCTIVCPTNGRPFGFDWEDWGRINAIETLDDAKRIYKPDADRIYLTGHSMGGHGTWSVGFNRPDLFAAIAPCAGWISFWSYGGAADWKDPDSVEKILRRASNSSDTLQLLPNSKDLGIFIQHGDADDNVPVEQAREMRKRLGEFHRDFDWHEEPGQSHWFDTDPEPGANVQDYAPLFDFFAKHRLPNPVDKRNWSITVVNPDGVRLAANLEILSQERSKETSKLSVRTFSDDSYEEASTENVSALRVTPLGKANDFKLKIDGQELTADLDGAWSDPWGDRALIKKDGKWSFDQIPATMKRLSDEGGIKRALQGAVLVYGTQGSKEEAEWTYNKARYDAETYWYRGNGTVELVPDTAWTPATKPQSVVFYGNSRTNKALAGLKLFGTVPSIQIGSKNLTGDLGVLWTNSLEGRAMVGIIGGTTLKGCRAIERCPLFLSGVHFPDVYVAAPEMLLKGSKGVVAAGFYGPDWSVEKGDFAFREP